MYPLIALITFYGLMIAGNSFTAYSTDKFCYHPKKKKEQYQFLGRKEEIS